MFEFKDLKDKIKDKRLILFGELHGTNEIPINLSKFFSEFAKTEDFNVCLEIPEEFQKQIEEFMRGDNIEILEKIRFFGEGNNSDGRGSIEYLDLIKNLYLLNKKYNRNIKIFFVDSNGTTQNERENRIAENILKHIENKKIFAILGEIHASKNQLLMAGLNITPAGFILFNKLKEKMFSIRIAPIKGKFFNFGVKEIAEDFSRNLFNKNFDYICNIGEVSICSFYKK